MSFGAQNFQLETHPLVGHVLLEASAGTGKTWTITNLVVRLLLDESKSLTIRDILVVTYTKMATAELRDRIRTRLVEVLGVFQAQLPEEDISDTFIRQLGANKTPAQLQWMQSKLERAISGFDEAAIFTIHGFCQRVLDTCAFESGADFGLEVIQDEMPIVRQMVLDEWRKQLYQGSPAWVNYIQSQLKLRGANHWLLLLKPYIGQTHLHLAPLEKEESLLDAQKKEASLADAMQSLCFLWKQKGEEACKILGAAIGTILNGRSYKKDSAPQLIEQMQEWIRLGEENTWAALNLLRNKDVFKLVEQWSEKHLDLRKKGKTAPTHDFFNQVQAVLDLYNELQSVHQACFAIMLRDLWLKLNQQLPRQKQDLQQASFDDLLRHVYCALGEDNPNRAELLRLLRSQFKAALIDEFQDTDPLQAFIFETIFANPQTPVFYVGDPKQAIYGFRGADVNAYLNVAQGVKERYSLQTNYRSSPLLLSAVNLLFGQNHHAFLEDAITYVAVQAPEKPPEPLIDLQQPNCQPLHFLLLPDAQGEASAKSDRLPWSISKREAEQNAAKITAIEVARLLQQAAQGQLMLGGRRLSGGDIAILVPSHRHATLMQSALQQHQIASVRKTEESVLHTDDAEHFYHLLCAIDNPAHLRILKGALLGPAFRVSLESLMEWEGNPEHLNQWQGIFTEWRMLWQQKGFMSAFRSLLATQGPDQASIPERLLRQVGGERRLTNYMHLAEILETQSATCASPSALLAWLKTKIQNSSLQEEELYSPQMRLESDADRVQIATVHSSKGLEYPIVFCPFLWHAALREPKQVVRVAEKAADGQWQNWLDFGSSQQSMRIMQRMDEDFREQLRLLYVALTRPKYRCYVVWGEVEVPKAPKQDVLKKGLHMAALTWLLHPPNAIDLNQPILPQLQAHCASLEQGRIAEQLYALAAQAPDAIVVQTGVLDAPHAGESKQDVQTPADLQVPTLTRFLRPQWSLSSFSLLSRGAGRTPQAPIQVEDMAALEDDSADAQPIVPKQALPQSPNIFNFPLREVPASVAGTCVHEILERWDWQQADVLAPLVAHTLQKYGLRLDWQATIMQMVQNTVQTPITPTGYALQAVLKPQRLAELSFMFPLTAITAQTLVQCLQSAGASLPALFVQAAQYLEFSTIGGYLNGFIDLVFCAPDGRYYLLDYKTNYLGDSLEDYVNEPMMHAMAHHHYYLQYLIYSVALHRYLQQRVADYNYATHFGGAIYLFLRGLNGQNSDYGVYTHCPDFALIQALEQCLIGSK